MTPNFASCDLCDAHKTDLSGNFRVLPPVMRDFGALRKFCGPVVTVKCFEDNTLVKLDDMYGHDKRVIQALTGTPVAKIAAADPARSQMRALDEAAPPMVRRALQKNARGDDE